MIIELVDLDDKLYYCCDICGATGWTKDEIVHYEDCPEEKID